jgi:phosphoglycolate phosphatase-like HAD superfamily hydrolase
MIEVLRPGISARNARVVMFDFDGTLSLIRSGWVHVMVPMMVDELEALKTGETREQLTAVVDEYVAKLTGKETIYQMIEFAAQIQRRGGSPQDPLAYKHEYLRRLAEITKDRIAALTSRSASPESYLVPGSRQLLEALRDRGLKLYLASGTDEVDVIREAELLDIARYFDGGIRGASDDINSFSKGALVKSMVDTAGYRGDEILVFGDGYVEIEVVKNVGGVAVGVCSNEPACDSVDEWKRQRLSGVGADFIVPHFGAHQPLMTALFD